MPLPDVRLLMPRQRVQKRVPQLPAIKPPKSGIYTWLPACLPKSRRNEWQCSRKWRLFMSLIHTCELNDAIRSTTRPNCFGTLRS
jgi:hypothetical protein